MLKPGQKVKILAAFFGDYETGTVFRNNNHYGLDFYSIRLDGYPYDFEDSYHSIEDRWIAPMPEKKVKPKNLPSWW